MVNIGPPDLLILGFFVLFGFLPLVLGVWTAIDASRYPDSAFAAAGTSKTLWIVLPLVGILACGLVALGAWFGWITSVRTRVELASAATGRARFPDGPPSGWSPPPGPAPGRDPGWPPPPPPRQPPADPR